jgi:nucleotide-binding universal stress UspA family protein
MRPILCVVDLTPSSEKVLEIAATVASACRTRLIVLYSYRLVDLGRDANVLTLKASMDARAEARFQELGASVLKDKDVVYEFQTEIGFVADRIRNYVNEKAAGMVVIGERQANDIDEHRALTVREFISNMKLPFLIIPEESKVELERA